MNMTYIGQCGALGQGCRGLGSQSRASGLELEGLSVVLHLGKLLSLHLVGGFPQFSQSNSCIAAQSKGPEALQLITSVVPALCVLSWKVIVSGTQI